MRLWNDYEGKTIAGNFPIEKLIRPEGRSAFFTTSNGSGKPAVLRLIESINDEIEILDRWKTVSDLKQTHLIAFKQFGQTILDGTPLIYAVMEATDADLSEILRERPLTAEETSEIAISLVEALKSLHNSGIIHEHIEPANVLATGELVKLRSDCIREFPEDPAEAAGLRARDVHDLAVVLLQALTQSRTLVPNGHTLLPKPFDQIIRNGISGTWGLTEISNALTPPAPAPIPQHPASATAPVKPQYTAPAKKPQIKTPNPDQAPLPLTGPSQADLSPAAVAASIPAAIHTPAPRPASAALDRVRLSLEADPKRKRLWIASSAAVLVVVAALGWRSLRSAPERPITPISEMAPSPAASTTPAPAKPSAAAEPSHARSANQPSNPGTTQTVATPDGRPQWRVVAFTYNREDQAWQKAAAIGRQHSFLRPEVFTPTGHAPYLVTVGGPMTREQAVAFKNKARSAGLPRDIYTQNYSGKGR